MMKVVAVTVVGVCCSTSAAVAQAARPSTEFPLLRAGQVVRLTMGADRYQGRIEAFDDQVIAVRVGEELQQVPVAQVDSLWFRQNYAGVGFLSGTAAGSVGLMAVACAAGMRPCIGPGLVVTGLAGGVVGTLIGLGIPRWSPRWPPQQPPD
jgi:hypothetical protein